MIIDGITPIDWDYSKDFRCDVCLDKKGIRCMLAKRRLMEQHLFVSAPQWCPYRAAIEKMKQHDSEK